MQKTHLQSRTFINESRGTKDQVRCAWRALNFSHIAIHHSGYLEDSIYDVGVERAIVIWNAFGLKIPDFAEFA